MIERSNGSISVIVSRISLASTYSKTDTTTTSLAEGRVGQRREGATSSPERARGQRVPCQCSHDDLCCSSHNERVIGRKGDPMHYGTRSLVRIILTPVRMILWMAM